MKDIMKYGIIMLAMAFGLTACSDSDDDITVGLKTNSDSINVGILTEGMVVMPSTATSFDIMFERNKDTGAISVPIKVYTDASDIFTAPSEVKFASGELQKKITVNVSDKIEMFKDYIVEVVVDENYTMQYSLSTVTSRSRMTVVKEDYKVVQKGTYLSWWTDEEEPAELEYSEMLQSYRFNKQTSGVFTFTFTLGEAIADEADELFGMQPITFSDDFLKNGCLTSEDWAHSDYGMVTMKGYTAQPSVYDPNKKVYYFDIQWRVSAGSFGDYYDVFTVTEP